VREGELQEDAKTRRLWGFADLTFASSRLPVLSLLFLLLPVSVSCGSGNKGIEAMASQDVRVVDGGAADSQGYEYVAKRPLAVVALAEARGIDAAVARAAMDRLADEMDACATEEGRRGTLVEGAARVVAQIDDGGIVAGTSMRVNPGAGVAQEAVVCFLAPVKMLIFPPVDGRTAASPGAARGMAVEAIWGKVVPKQ
jgi:hypothetical protein